jgi:EAL domain-containing protein (putative c-di-GMP-specific phosphodiesterase class I)
MPAEDAADRAVGGTNVVAFCHSLAARDGGPPSMADQLRHALADGDVTVVYQPVIDCGTGDVESYEALARWTHPQLGPIEPAAFIPVAEESGRIIRLGAVVMRAALATASGLPSRRRIAVNIAMTQLRRRDVTLLVRDLLDDAAVAADRLELEFGDAVLAPQETDARRSLVALADLGVRLTLDDFDMVLTKLDAVRQLPIRRLKIDRHVVGRLGDPRDARDTARAVRSVITAAGNFGMSVVAEGVETAIQFRALRGCGCALMQGFMIEPPVTADELRAA